MKNIQILLHDNQEVAQTYDVIDGQLLTIQNVRGVNYELLNTLNGTAPQNIIARRVGQDLFIILDENEGAGSPNEINPDVVIKDYYGDIEEEQANGLDKSEGEVTDATGILIGLHENGKYYAYIPESAESSDAVSILADGDAEPQAIGGEELACGAVFFPWWGLLGLLPLLGVPFLLKGGDDKPVPPAPELIPPVAKDDSYTATAGRPVELKPLAKDIDDDLATLKIKSINGVELTGKPQLIDIPNKGIVRVDADGKITFTPNSDVKGEVEFPYVIVDKDGQESTAKEIITVAEVPVPPTPGLTPDVDNDVKLNQPAGSTVTLDVTKNDDSNIDPKTVKLLDKDGNPVDTLDVPNEGKWTVNPDGTVSFKPEPTFKGNPTPVEYTAKDTNGMPADKPATITITYQDKPAEPKATLEDDAKLNNPYGTPVTQKIVDNDDKEINPETIKLIDKNGNEVGKKLVVPNEGTWVVNDKGEVTFTPEKDFKGDPTPIEYTAKDNAGKDVEAPAKIIVTYKDSATLKDDENLDNPIGKNVIVNLIENDPDKENINKSTTVTFDPDDTFKGNPTPIKYTAKTTDGGLVEEPATITVTYKDAVVPPTPDVRDDVKLGWNVGDTASINVVANDGNDNIDPKTVKLVGGTDGGKKLVVPDEGTWTVAEDGTVSFTPFDTFKGDPTPVEYTAQNTSGVDAKEPATITFGYKQPPVNQPPVAINDEAKGDRDPQTGKLLAKKQPIVNDDIDPD